MAGKPAARLTDPTAHGGTIVGPGVPTVMIGKMPAATMGDNHVCPMVTPATPPIPHVGGPIVLGSMGVMIGKKPAARMGDMAVCVGPPSSVIMGCPTVLIGEAGGGGGGGSAGSAAAAQAASVKGPKAISPLEPPEPPEQEALENHEIQIQFTDANGQALPAVGFTLKDPDGNTIRGSADAEGGFVQGGFAKQGSYSVEIPSLGKVELSPTEVDFDKKISVKIEVKGTSQTEAHIIVNAHDTRGQLFSLQTIPCAVQGEKISVDWLFSREQLKEVSLPKGHSIESISFTVVCGNLVSVSPKAKMVAKAGVEQGVRHVPPQDLFLSDSDFPFLAGFRDLEKDALQDYLSKGYSLYILLAGKGSKDTKSIDSLEASRGEVLQALFMHDTNVLEKKFRSKQWGVKEMQALLQVALDKEGTPFYEYPITGEEDENTKAAADKFLEMPNALQSPLLAKRLVEKLLEEADLPKQNPATSRIFQLMAGGKLEGKAQGAIEFSLWPEACAPGLIEFKDAPEKVFDEMKKNIAASIGEACAKFILSN